MEQRKVSKFHGTVLPRYSVRQSRRGKRTDESTGLLVIQHSTYQQHHRGAVLMYSMHDHLDLPISALHCKPSHLSSPPRLSPLPSAWVPASLPPHSSGPGQEEKGTSHLGTPVHPPGTTPADGKCIETDPATTVQKPLS